MPSPADNPKSRSDANSSYHARYDGAKRRTIKDTYTAGVLSETRHFYFTDPARWQVIEERVGTSTAAQRQFVWGLRYIDDLVVRDRDATGSGSGTLDERLYGLQDPNWNMVAIVGSTGAVQERFSYDAYGAPTFLTGGFATRTASLFAWETLYAGHRFDSDSRLYAVRHRVLHALLGWLRRDPTNVSDHNLYRYCVSRPLIAIDPSGLTLVVNVDFESLLSQFSNLSTCFCGFASAADI
ncbi:MAG: hypothetical protein KGK35_11920, partial [Xanthomonadaceae bacterium]|nr:hypothetical protein [Xanthomonadaceae bacterium]